MTDAALHPYHDYRNVDLRWLDRVPAHWEVRRLKSVIREVNERSARGEETHLSMSQKYGLVDTSRIESWRMRSESYAGGKLCREGDLVLNRLKAHLGVFAHAPQAGVVSPDYSVFRITDHSNVKYLESLLKTPTAIAKLKSETKGIVEGFWRLYTEELTNIRVPVPTPSEQDAIVRFVTALSDRVDSLIRAKQKLIALLNEQKQAIIQRAVTRGLDPNVPLKHSGVDWLGDVPEHWEVRPLKHWVRMNEAVLPEHTPPSFTFRYFDIAAVGTGHLSREPETITFGGAPSRARRIIRQGDTLISTVRTYLKAVYHITEAAENLVASTGFAVLSPKREVDPSYLSLAIQSDLFVNRVTAYSTGIAYPAINESTLGRFQLAMPSSRSEQQDIVRRVAEETAPISAAIDRSRTEIDLIREYRTRLIADIVTGKLDVRGVTLPEVHGDGADIVPDDIEDDITHD